MGWFTKFKILQRGEGEWRGREGKEVVKEGRKERVRIEKEGERMGEKWRVREREGGEWKEGRIETENKGKMERGGGLKVRIDGGKEREGGEKRKEGRESER